MRRSPAWSRSPPWTLPRKRGYPHHGYKNAIDDELQDATAVLDAFLPRKRG